jgi:hypothetical protein
MAKAMTLGGLDVHARQTHAAVLVLETGELRSCPLRRVPEEVVAFLAGLEERSHLGGMVAPGLAGWPVLHRRSESRVIHPRENCRPATDKQAGLGGVSLGALVTLAPLNLSPGH